MHHQSYPHPLSVCPRLPTGPVGVLDQLSNQSGPFSDPPQHKTCRSSGSSGPTPTTSAARCATCRKTSSASLCRWPRWAGRVLDSGDVRQIGR